jgi:hypothetical protein
MNEQEREQIDILIRGFLDGELTQRQRTELKRLAQHNPSVKKELHALYRQKELYSALPVEKAPKDLAEEVRRKLERRMILDAEPAAQVRPLGRAHLLFRRIAAAAAMLFLPLGILAILVVQIIKPVDEMPMGTSPTAGVEAPDQAIRSQANPVAAGPEKTMVLSLGCLTLVTDQPIAVNELIKNGIVSNALLSGASSQRSESSAIYRIQCRQGQMLSLLGSLEPVWRNCSKQQLVLTSDDPSAAKAVAIEGIRPDQLKSLAEESNPVRMQMIAAHIERLNRINPEDYRIQVEPEGQGGPGAVLEPVKPRIAWTEESRDQKAAGPVQTGEGPEVVLVIEVKNQTGNQ